MCPPSSNPNANPLEQRRVQIMEAAMACFARRGFHQTTMQDISQEAGTSVGLIYRYFESKEQVIATMVTEHLRELEHSVEAARQLPTLFDALEKVLWCDEKDAGVAASFVLDLFAESARNPQVRQLVRQVQAALIQTVTDLIASSPEAKQLAPGVGPQHAAELVFHTIHGLMFDEVLHADARTQADLKTNRTETLRWLWVLLFPALSVPASSAVADHDAP